LGEEGRVLVSFWRHSLIIYTIIYISLLWLIQGATRGRKDTYFRLARFCSDVHRDEIEREKGVFFSGAVLCIFFLMPSLCLKLSQLHNILDLKKQHY
jgi:hypothetical protein